MAFISHCYEPCFDKYWCMVAKSGVFLLVKCGRLWADPVSGCAHGRQSYVDLVKWHWTIKLYLSLLPCKTNHHQQQHSIQPQLLDESAACSWWGWWDVLCSASRLPRPWLLAPGFCCGLRFWVPLCSRTSSELQVCFWDCWNKEFLLQSWTCGTPLLGHHLSADSRGR